jgi:hypothetical protein
MDLTFTEYQFEPTPAEQAQEPTAVPEQDREDDHAPPG